MKFWRRLGKSSSEQGMIEKPIVLDMDNQYNENWVQVRFGKALKNCIIITDSLNVDREVAVTF